MSSFAEGSIFKGPKLSCRQDFEGVINSSNIYFKESNFQGLTIFWGQNCQNEIILVVNIFGESELQGFPVFIGS